MRARTLAKQENLRHVTVIISVQSSLAFIYNLPFVLRDRISHRSSLPTALKFEECTSTSHTDKNAFVGKFIVKKSLARCARR